ncbi:hypothetical protein LCGC14_1052380 [marine sediment metagenome]|uniref:Uncharacterized protein n=1 Tax=marine sediment metagenome TaxID=412755 RepID=A0A0F9MSY0_9ZZZZ
MKKLSDYKDEEKQDIRESVNLQGKKIIDSFYEEGHQKVSDDSYGLCADCKEFKITKMEFGETFAECGVWDKRRTSQRKVEECSAYVKRGQMTLFDMQQMAYIIEVDTKKIGF